MLERADSQPGGSERLSVSSRLPSMMNALCGRGMKSTPSSASASFSSFFFFSPPPPSQPPPQPGVILEMQRALYKHVKFTFCSEGKNPKAERK